MRLRILKAGLFVIAIAATAVGVSQADPQKSLEGSNVVYIPLLIEKAEPQLFGVQMYGNTSSGSKYHQFLTDSGASWLRVSVAWKAIEPSNTIPENYDWRSSDRNLGAARPDMAELNVIATIDDNPLWASPYLHGPINPGNLGDYAEFIGALVERFDGDGLDDAPGSPVVDYWEFYNEPDRGDNGPRWGHFGAEYAKMLTEIYPVVKASNPRAQVVFGGLAYDWFEDQGGVFVREFLDDVLSAGGGQYFDIMNFHAYPSFWFNWTSQKSPALLEKAQFIEGKLGDYGIEKPLVITEAGWHSNNTANFPGSPEIQARYVVELFTQSMAADLEAMIWWMLYDPGGSAWDNGLVTNDSTPLTKPSFDAFQTIINELGSADFNRVLTSGETGASDMEAYKFTDGTKSIYVAWLNPIDNNAKRPLKLTGSQATVSNIYGVEGVVLDSDDGKTDGRVTVQIGSQPSYIRIGN